MSYDTCRLSTVTETRTTEQNWCFDNFGALI
jgi:hypothetical protein